METNQCCHCKRDLPYSAFYKDKDSGDGYAYRCKNCKRLEYEARKRRRMNQEPPPETTMKRCSKCGEVKPLAEYHKAYATADGRKDVCKACSAAHSKVYAKTPNGRAVKDAAHKRYTQSEHGKEVLRERKRRERADGNHKPQEQARAYVQRMMRKHGFPRPYTLPCADCGQQATQYHHESYERDRWLDVIPLCAKCHKARHMQQEETA